MKTKKTKKLEVSSYNDYLKTYFPQTTTSQKREANAKMAGTILAKEAVRSSIVSVKVG